MEDVGKAWVLICWVIRSANLAGRLNLPLSMLDAGLPARTDIHKRASQQYLKSNIRVHQGLAKAKTAVINLWSTRCCFVCFSTTLYASQQLLIFQELTQCANDGLSSLSLLKIACRISALPKLVERPHQTEFLQHILAIQLCH